MKELAPSTARSGARQQLTTSKSSGTAARNAQVQDTAASNAQFQDMVDGQQREGGTGMLRGWWDAATGWLGDKTEAVGSAVSDAWDGVSSTVGDYWDAVAGTDLDWEDDKVSLSTDLDTLLPVLPDNVREAIMLGGVDPAANRVLLSLDRAAGSVVLEVADLQLGAFTLGDVSGQSLSLSGLRVQVEDAAALVRETLTDETNDPLIGWVLGEEYKGRGNDASLSVACVEATGVVGPDGQGAQSITVRNLQVDTTSKGGGLLAAEGAPEQLDATFSVGEVAVAGATVGDAGADSLTARDLQGQLSPGTAEGQVYLGLLAAQGLHSGDTRVGDAEVRELHSRLGSKDLTSVAGLHGSGTARGVRAHEIDVGANHLGGVDMGGVSFDHQGDQTDIRLDQARVTGLQSGKTSLGSASLQHLDVGYGAGRTDVDLEHVSLGDLVTGGTSIDGADLQGIDVAHTPGHTDFDLDRARVDGLSAGRTSLDSATLQGVDATRTRATTRGTARSASVDDLVTPGFTADRIQGRRLAADVQNDLGYVGVYAGGLQGEGMHTRDVDIDDASFHGVDTRTAIKRSGVISTGTVVDGRATGVHTDGASIAGASLSDLSWRRDLGGAGVQADKVGATGVDTESLDVDRVLAQGLSIKRGDQGTKGSLGRLSAAGLTSTTGGTSVSVDSAQVSQLSGRSGDSGAGVRLAHGDLHGVSVHVDPTTGKQSTAPAASASKSSPSTSSATRSSSATGKGSGIDIPSLAGLVDDADLTASVPLAAADYGLLEVEEGTVATAQARVRNGKIDPRHTRVDASSSIDGPAWVGVEGAYLEQGDHGGARVRPELSGMYDLDVTNDISGVKGDLPLDLKALAGMATGSDKTSAPATQKAGGGAGGAGGVTETSSSGGVASTPSPVDLARLQVQGSVGLNGELALPGVHGTFAREQDSDNRVDVQVQGTDKIAIAFVRMLVSALTVDVGGTSAQAGELAVGDASVSVDRSGAGSRVDGDIGRVRVEDLDVRR